MVTLKVVMAGALVWWLREVTCNEKVVISTPSTVYWWTFFTLFVVKIVVFD